ncbi:hypothetical protein M153_1600003212 [Pseudoloma neurophilia]|uniref:Uncharacterized protein n=1 Tax=Pseudoloma neurophilia TaxID=146866 RepID=A0A0R0M039_9MICR|nr:hypothetical protein M153_1600003212 [Pseudoloma neurophilia]
MGKWSPSSFNSSKNYSSNPSYSYRTLNYPYSTNKSYQSSSTSAKGEKPVWRAIGYYILGIFVILFVIFIYIKPIFIRWRYRKKIEKFRNYLQRNEMNRIVEKYFGRDTSTHFMIMNRAIIDGYDGMCVSSLNNHARELIDERLFDRFNNTRGRIKFRSIFLDVILRFNKFMKRLLFIRNPHSAQIVNHKLKETPVEDILPENIESSSEDEIKDDPVRLSFDSSFISSKNRIKLDSVKYKYYYSILNQTILLRDFLLSDSVFPLDRESIAICIVTPLLIEIRVFEHFKNQFQNTCNYGIVLTEDIAQHMMAYVLEAISTEYSCTKIDVLLKNINNHKAIPEIGNEKHIILKID